MADLHPTLLALLDHVQQQVPALGRHVLEATTHALQSEGRHYRLQEAWARRRKRFVMEFESELLPQLARIRRGELAKPPRPSPHFEGLDLVDEQQALQDVAVNQVVEMVNEACATDLYQLVNFFTALDQGRSRGRDPNALRPALFARSLVLALAGSDLQSDTHFALVRVAGAGLVEALQLLYRELAQRLREAQLGPLVMTRPGSVTPRPPEPPPPSPISLPSAPPLADLADRAPKVAALAPALQPLADREGLLERLYERMLADPGLLPPVKAQLARLQVAVASLSRIDPSLLRRNDHPAWRLINAVAAYASGLSETQDTRLPEFLQFLAQQTQRLVDAAEPSTEHFERVQRELDAFIVRQARERSQPSPAALAQLEREKQRPAWVQALRAQLEHQLNDSGQGGRAARRFLLGPWAETVAQAMVQAGPESAIAQRLIDLVDPIIDSLRPRTTLPEREQLRQTLPSLVAALESALEPLDLSDTRRKSLISELIQLQGRALSGRGVPASASPPAEVPNEAAISRFVEERDSEFASVWASAEVDRGALPTQPLPLPDESLELQFAQAQRWLDQLQVGGWFHLCLADSWLTAQLVWISTDHHYFVFISQETPDHRHTLTAGALLRLYLNGLAMYLEEEGLMERALGTLLNDLHP